MIFPLFAELFRNCYNCQSAITSNINPNVQITVPITSKTENSGPVQIITNKADEFITNENRACIIKTKVKAAK